MPAAELSDDLGVSEIIIRRDLLLLEQEGVLERTYGGAVIRKQTPAEQHWEDTAGVQQPQKADIAKAAADMIEMGDTVFLGSGSTAATIVRHLPADMKLRIVAHNLAAALEVRGPGIEFVFLGGLYRPQIGAVEGSWSIDMLAQFNADKTFLGADCLDVAAGLTTPGLAVADLELAMIRRTRRGSRRAGRQQQDRAGRRGRHLPARPDRRRRGRQRCRPRGLHPGRTAHQCEVV